MYLNERQKSRRKRRKSKQEQGRYNLERASVIANSNSDVVTMREFRRKLMYIEREREFSEEMVPLLEE